LEIREAGGKPDISQEANQVSPSNNAAIQKYSREGTVRTTNRADIPSSRWGSMNKPSPTILWLLFFDICWGIDHRVLLFFFVSGEVLSSRELVLVILLLLSCCNFGC